MTKMGFSASSVGEAGWLHLNHSPHTTYRNKQAEGLECRA